MAQFAIMQGLWFLRAVTNLHALPNPPNIKISSPEVRLIRYLIRWETSSQLSTMPAFFSGVPPFARIFS